ncbi:MAG: CotH kinase family protein [Lachnospiraceae bacterium]|nr:CotH kinase family protein [Lachnospiraceae bacterium]
MEIKMHKRFLRFAFIVGSFICFLCLTYRAGGGHRQRLFSYFADEAEFDSLLEERSETNRDFVNSISVDGQMLVKDIDTDTFYYSINETGTSAYNPIVEPDLTDRNARLAVKKKYITNDFIETNDTIELIVYTDNVYKRYYLKATLLPIMEISCPRADSEADVPMRMRLYDNRANVGYRVSDSEGSMHIRGGTSINYPKKGWKLSLKNPERMSLLGMRSDDDWILYAAYNDQERIRNVFSTKLWKEGCASNNRFGIDNGVEYKYVELFLNGSYYGLYALGYPVDDDVLDIADGEYTYKKKYWDWEAAEDFSKPGAMAGYELESRRENDISAWKPLRDYYELLYSPQPRPDSELISAVDIGNSIDTYIFLNLIQGADHVDNRSIHNVYITAKLMADDYIMLYTPWDMDQAWGNVWSDDALNWCEAYGAAPEDNYVLNSGAVAALVNRGNEVMINAVSWRYEELREGAWSDENINKLIDGYETDIYESGAYLRDMERWGDATSQNPEIGLELFREYVLARFEYADEYYGRNGD